MQKLSNAPAGRYTIKWIFTDSEIRDLLSLIHVEVGREVIVLQRHPLGGSLLRSSAGSFYVDSDIISGVTV